MIKFFSRKINYISYYKTTKTNYIINTKNARIKYYRTY